MSPAINMEDVWLQALYDELFLAIYKYSYDKLELQRGKRWSILEKFRVQYTNWSRSLKQEAREQDAEVNRFVQRMESFQAYSLDLQDIMLDCHRTGWKVDPAQMKLLRNSWCAVIARGKNILDDPLACDKWAERVAMEGKPRSSTTGSVSDDDIGPPLRLRRAIEKLVAFHRHVSTLIRFTSSRRMRSNFFSRELKVSPVEKEKRPSLIGWPYYNQDWLNLLSTIYEKQNLERVTGQRALSSERKFAQRAAGYGKAATVHCECAMVVSLDESCSAPACSYIGISKLSCKPCYYWIQAYNKIAGTKFCTKGSHDKWYKGWARPELSKAEVQNKVDASFLESVENELCMKLVDSNMVRNGSASDSSDSSESHELVFNDDREELVMKKFGHLIKLNSAAPLHVSHWLA